MAVSAPRSEIPQLRAKLLERFDGATLELKHARLHRMLYEAIRDEIVTRYPQADGTFLNSYSQLYIRGQIMAVRRLVDTTKDRPDSLHWIIQTIRSTPQLASRAMMLEAVGSLQQEPDWRRIADADFTARFGASDTPSDEWLAGLQKELKLHGRLVAHYADRQVAHRDPRGRTLKLKYSEVHDALDGIAEVANSVEWLLLHSSTHYTSVLIEGDWQEPFRPALFPFPLDIYRYPDPRGFI
jgi:hypothetical protein